MPLVATDLVFEGPADAPPAPAGSPELAAQSFYAALAAGDWASAWDVSVEPAWPQAGTAAWTDEVAAGESPAGWTARDAFVQRCRDDIGSGIRLNSVTATPGSRQRGRAGLDLARALGARRVAAVHVSGHMLGACLIYRWEKDLEVAEMGGRWKVILPGTRPARQGFHREWFSDVTLIGSLRAQPQTPP
jgi:hypothetical protein